MKKNILVVLTTAIMLIVGADNMVAQTVIDGMVTDSLGMPVDAYVTVSPKGESSIIGFAARMAIGQHVRMVANRSQRLNFVVSSGYSWNWSFDDGNLADMAQTYTRVNYSGLDIYTATSRLRPMSVVAKVRFKLL